MPDNKLMDRWRTLQMQENNHRSRRDEAAGAIKQLIAELKSRHGVKDVEQGRKELQRKMDAEAKLSSKVQKMLDGVEEQWGDKLGD